MIKRLMNPEEVALLIKANDDVEERYKITRGEWIQFLVTASQDEKTFIIASFDDQNEVRGYLFAQNYINPPLSRVVHIIYAYSPENNIDNELAMDQLREWAMSLGADKITASTKQPEVLLGKYGFKESQFHILEIDL